MEQLPALSTLLCTVLLIHTWEAEAAAEIPGGCKTAGRGESAQKPDGLRVSQEPRSYNVTAGETMTLSCTFQYKEGMRVKALWIRGSGEDVVLDSNHPFYRGRLNMSKLDEVKQGKATLTLSQVEKRDSGMYQCCIDIQNKEPGMGESTELRVMKRNRTVPGNGNKLQQESSTELTVYRAVITLAAIGTVILAGILILYRHKAVATGTQLQQPTKRAGRSASNPSEGLHYAEITVKAPAHTEYASVRTQRL